MPQIVCQQVDGTAQFDGAVGQGQWLFSQYNNLPRSTGITIALMSYIEDGTGPPPLTVAVAFYAVAPAAPNALHRIPLGLGDAKKGELLNIVTGNAEAKFCGLLLPREPGDGGAFWSIICLTKEKAHDARACVEWVTCPLPETDGRDSPDR